MKLLSRIPVILVLLLTARLLSAADVHYVAVDDIDVKQLLSGPPADGSPQQQEEIATLLHLQNSRTTADIARCMAEVPATPFIFSQVLGDSFSERTHPLTASLLYRAREDTETIFHAVKNQWNRTRPYITDPRIHPCVPLEKTASYPSGHATRGIVWATILSEIFPDKKEALMAFGKQVGDDRAVAGVHYPSDIEAGQTLGAEIARRMLANPQFQMQLEQARQECVAAASSETPVFSQIGWPARVFVPYMYLGNGDHFKLTACDDAIGVKYYTLAFVVADSSKNPAWYGQVPMDLNLYGDQITAIRKRGGDVICSFGGADGAELADAEANPAKLQAKYQSVIDQYKFTWLDFDIEGDNLDKHPQESKRRNEALAAIQKNNPGLNISYTLPVDPNGLSSSSLELLRDARARGLKVHSANIMVMFFGEEFVRTGKTEGELSIESALKAREQTRKIDLDMRIGLCPCIGTNGSKKEIFNQNDARELRAFADKTDWVCSLSFWSMNRDSEANHGPDTNSEIPAQPWDFANAFKSFTAPLPTALR